MYNAFCHQSQRGKGKEIMNQVLLVEWVELGNNIIVEIERLDLLMEVEAEGEPIKMIIFGLLPWNE